uniref:Virion infectivity factor n=1 Tax=Simian immunodeficiency virus TaxID=11723 RepID=Q3HRR9_SIV|nr:vif protein [Simian immunodeficiency virus]ABA54156.1 vif protein [Simian immunodeficiency virus]ABA54165.1 vif protein [Simian immunodeficiency virus]
MEEEKNWIVVPTWRIPERLERWHSLIKHLKYNTKDLQMACYVPHHKVGWAWWTCSRVIFPLRDKTHLEVQGYWNLTPEKGWLSTHAVRITWYSRNFWTDVTPDCADTLLHSTYFPCFSEGEVQRAIRGEKLLSCCKFPKAHKNQVPSLQYLALTVVSHVRSQREDPTWKQWRGNNRRGFRMAKQNSRRNKQGSSKSPAEGANFPGLAKVLGILA